MSDATVDGLESQPSTSSTTVQWSHPCRQFEFQEIQAATDDFDESLVIGHGGFGKVYRGTIFHGSTPVIAAIKRLDSSSNQGAPEFWAEVEMLSKLRHCHLVSLFGYCSHGKEMILVYEFMPNGTLEDQLHKLRTPLSWLQRLKICVGAACGLHYLHTGTGIDHGVIHRDVKSSNILLHESWAAKISDFGLSRIGPTNQPSTYVNTLVKGTFGYFDPDYYLTGRLTRKSDVYAFGVILLEVLCRKRAVDRSLDEEQWNLARWAQEHIKQGNLKHIIDYGIRGEISPKCLKEFVRIAERCLVGDPKQRSTMAEVVVGLESVLTLQQKMNSSLHPVGRTLFGRMVDKFPFPFNGEKSVSAQVVSKPSSNRTSASTGEVPADGIRQSLKELKFADLKRATRNFSQDLILGKGGFGMVYLGWVDKDTFTPSRHGVGIPVAVKRLNLRRGQLEKCRKEANLFSRVAHPNIISLLGFSSDERIILVVYEFMQNGSFDHFLYGNEHIAEPISWGQRLSIIIGVAHGLVYLHSLQLIHRGVKPSNILLDQDFNAKLGDFGIAKVLTDDNQAIYYSSLFTDSIGYLDPDFMRTGCFTMKNDIYSFGVVLLQTLTGREPVVDTQPQGLQHLIRWAEPFLEEKSELKKIMDPRLEENYPLEGAFECAVLALRCVAMSPKDRPSSIEVLRSLEQIYAVHK